MHKKETYNMTTERRGIDLSHLAEQTQEVAMSIIDRVAEIKGTETIEQVDLRDYIQGLLLTEYPLDTEAQQTQ